MGQQFGISYLKEGDKMVGNDNLIYKFNEHGLYYEIKDYSNKEIMFALCTVTLNFDYDTGELLSVTGFLPLVNAICHNIKIPAFNLGKYSISMTNIEYLQGVAYDYSNHFEESGHYLMKDRLTRVSYDKENKIILIGIQSPNDNSIKINKNIICGFDENENLKYLMLLLDSMIND